MEDLPRSKPLHLVMRYVAAVVAVAAGEGLRRALEARFGPGLPPYITFYPAVMVVALLAGFGPGLLATVLTGLTVDYWILPPVGQLAIASPVDRLGMVVFGGMGLFMSVVAELYRRSRQKAAAYDREVALRESREALRRQAELMDPVRAGDHCPRDATSSARAWGRGIGRANARYAAACAGRGGCGGGRRGSAGIDGLGVRMGAAHKRPAGVGQHEGQHGLVFPARGRGAGAPRAARSAADLRGRRRGRERALAGRIRDSRHFGLDQLWVRDPGDAQTQPGRMAQVTGISFLLASLSLLLVGARARPALCGAAGDGADGGRDRRHGLARLCLRRAAALRAGRLFQHGAGDRDGAGAAGNRAGLRRSDGFVAEFVGTRLGGTLARRLLPAAILLPAIAGWLRVLGSKTGLFEPNFGTGLFVIAMMVGFAALVWWTAHAQPRRRRAPGNREPTAQPGRVDGPCPRGPDRARAGRRHPLVEPRRRALYGWPAAEALGRRLHDLLRTEGADLAEIDAQLDRTGRWEGELVHAAHDGRRVAVNVSMTASRTGNNHLFILESSRDITARKRTEEQLRERERQFRTLADSIPNLAWWADGDGYITWYNRRWFEYTGTTPEQMEGWGWQSVHDPGELPRVLERWTASIATGEPFDMIFPLRGADGVFRPFLTRVMPLKDETGRVTRWFGTSTDVSEQKRTEEALRERKRLLQDVIDGSTSPIFLKDRDGRFITINASLERMLGMSREELEGKTDYDIAPKEVADCWRIHDTRVMATGKALQIEEVADLQDGHHVFLADKFPLMDADGKVYGVGAISQDITDRKRSEELLRESEQRLAGVLERLRLLGDNLPDSAVYQYVHETDGSVRFLYSSAGIEKLNGVSVADVLGDAGTLYRQIPPEYIERLVEAEARSKRDLSDFDMELPMRRPDGEMRRMRLRSRPRRLPDGRTVWDGVQTDVTEPGGPRIFSAPLSPRRKCCSRKSTTA